MSKLNANAKPFAFNIKASSFVPTQFTAAAAAAGAAPANNNNTTNNNNNAPAPATTTPAPATTTTPASAPAPTPAPKPAATVTVIGASKPAASVTVIGGKPKETPKPAAAAPASTPAPAAAPTPSPAPTTTTPAKPVTDSWEDLDNNTSSSSSSSTAPSSSSSSSSSGPASTPASAPSTSSSSSSAPSTTPATASAEEEEPELTEEEKKELAEIEAAEAAEEAAAAEEKSVSSDGVDASGKAEKKGAPLKAYHDEREHLNIVFIGHVDAGKSTISGQILFQTGQVDRRTIEKYEKEAKEKNRESWYLAYVMDTSEEERNRGKTVEVGRAHFTTAKKRYTLLDAPGHRSYVPNMIGGASQADVGVLVISARKGEFEAGLERGGQTREHAMLAKTLGLSRLIVLINKMDDKSVEWSKERYDEIVDKLSPVLKRWGYNLKTDVFYTPCSGLTGAGIKDPLSDDVATWLPKDSPSRRSFFQILDDLPPMERDINAPLRLPVMAKYKDMGATFVIGKLESGSLYNNRKLIMTPNQKEVVCTGVAIDEVDVDYARPGENVLVKLKGIEEEEIQTGFVLSYLDNPCKRSKKFDASIVVLDLLEHKPIITAGYSCVLHLHTLTAECIISGLISETDKKTGEKSKRRPKYAKSGAIIECRIAIEQSVAVETFKDFPQLGRFTLRDEGKTIMIGKVTKIFPE